MIVSILAGAGAMGDVRLSQDGKMVFVPAASPNQKQRYTLAVRGWARSDAAGEAATAIEYLPGAVFGIYAPDASGEMQPWPDPRAPQSPYRIRTEDAPVSFDLPEGVSFSIRQESAPSGYLPMADAYWPIAEMKTTDLRADNWMEARLDVVTQRTDGGPLAGTSMRLVQGDQVVQEGKTGPDGLWRIDGLVAGEYLLESIDVPAAMLPAPNPQRIVTVRDALYLRETFVHQEMSRLVLDAGHIAMQNDGKPAYTPFADVEVTVLDVERRPVLDAHTGQPVAWVTDAAGMAQGALPAGSYILSVTRQPAGGRMLAQETLFEIVDGQDTEMALQAVAPEGYLRVTLRGGANGDVPIPGVCCVWTLAGYEAAVAVTDAAGVAVTPPLQPGRYALRIEGMPSTFALPQTYQVGSEEHVLRDAAIDLPATSIQSLDIVCPAVLTGAWKVELATIGEDGEVQASPLRSARFEVLRADASLVMDVQNEVPVIVASDDNGMFTCTLPAGDYLLRAIKDQPALPPLSGADIAFSLPQEQETLIVRGIESRIIVRAVQPDGARLSGGAYRVRDAHGQEIELTIGVQGEAVTPLLASGVYQVETVTNPEGFGPAQAQEITCVAGEPAVVEMQHLPFGQLEAKLFAASLDAQGNVQQLPVAGARVWVLSLRPGQDAGDLNAYDLYPHADAPMVLLTNAQGVACGADGALPSLPAGVYRIRTEETLALHDEVLHMQGPSEPAQMADGAIQPLQLVLQSDKGGVRIVLRDALQPDMPLAEALFELEAETAQGEEAQYIAVDASGEALQIQLPSGIYWLRQLRAPQGYDPIEPLQVEVHGGTLRTVSLTNARRGTLSVDKQGYTFDADMQNFRVPLRGAYRLYTLEGGEYRPYQLPEGGGEVVLCANGMTYPGGVDRVELPATPQGKAYYLREVEGSAAQGYLADAVYHEVLMYPAQHAVADIAATADKGFFVVRHTSLVDQAPLTGGRFTLYAQAGYEDGAPVWEPEPVQVFEVNGDTYQNRMALPVGTYRLVLDRAPEGYMLDARLSPIECILEIPAYVRRGNPMAQIEVRSQPIPAQGQALLADAVLPPCSPTVMQTLEDPSGDIVMVDIGDAQDAQGAAVFARLTYRVVGGGWNWSDTRDVALAQGEHSVSLTDVQGRIDAVRIQYVDARTGNGEIGAGFAAGPVTVYTAGAQGTNVVETSNYRFYYLDETGTAGFALGAQAPATKATQPVADRAARGDDAGDGTGGVTGWLWLEQLPLDGVPNGEESGGEVLGSVRLSLESLDENGGATVVATVRPDERGHYKFVEVPYGTYRVRVLPSSEFLPVASVLQSARDEAIDSALLHAEESWTAPFELTAHARWHWAPIALVRVANVEGSFWVDENLNGLREDGERGVEGATLSLLQDGQACYQTQADAQGRYALESVAPGEYVLHAQLPQGYRIIEPEQWEEGVRVAVQPGEAVSVADTPVMQTARVSGVVWADDNGDAVRDAGEAGIPNLRVSLLAGEAGEWVATASTDEQGVYAFEALPPGTYSVRVVLPDAYILPQQAQWSVHEGAAAQTEPFALPMGAQRVDLDMPTALPATVQVAVWEDRRYQGERAQDDPGVPGARVAILPEGVQPVAGQSAAWQVTGPDGLVQFDQLPPGRYCVWYELPGNWRLTRGFGALQASNGHGEPFALRAQDARSISLGLMQPAAVHGRVFLDDNDNGLWDAGEQALPGIEVLLEALEEQAETRRVQSDTAGDYRLEELPPGAYRLTFVLPGGYLSGKEAPAIQEFSLSLGQERGPLNIGMLQSAGFSGEVWADADGNGARDQEEGGLGGAHLALYRGTGKYGTGQTLVAEQVTGADGSYRFEQLRPGAYQLVSTLPDGYVHAQVHASNVRFVMREEQELRSEPFTLTAGSHEESVSIGGLRLGSISGAAWEDINANGRPEEGEPALRGVAVTLYAQGEENAVAAGVTDREGNYRFDGLWPGQYQAVFTVPTGYVCTAQAAQGIPIAFEREITVDVYLEMGEGRTGLDVGALIPAQASGRLWLDRNDNGLLDAGEPPLPGGAEVALMEIEGEGEPVAITTPDEYGNWGFQNVLPGQYRIRVTLPENYIFASVPARDTARSAQIAGVDARVGQTSPLALAHGVDKKNIYIGAIPIAAIEGAVWLDADDDGVYGASESVTEGVRVALMSGAQTVRETVTTQGGYAFEGLRPGAYSLRFELPEGHLFARAPENAQAGGLVQGVNEARAESVPFALEMGARLSDQNIGVIEAAGIQGRFWLDANEDGAMQPEEAAYAGVLVELLDAQGKTVLASGRTAQDGAYTFEGLRPGEYQLAVTLPEGYLFTDQAAQMFPEIDAAFARTTAFPLQMGEARGASGIGILKAAAVRGLAWEDLNLDGAHQVEEPPLHDTQVTLQYRHSDAWIDEAEQTVGGQGEFAFEGLRPGEYRLQITLPGDFLPASLKSDPQTPFRLVMGEERDGVRIGGIRPGLVGDTAWIDENGNGLQDYGEPPLPGVSLDLLALGSDGSEETVGHVVTDAYGLYRFVGLRPGTYRLRATLPQGFAFTENRPEMPQIDSDLPVGQGGAGYTEPFVVQSGQARRDIDIGARAQ